MADSSRKIAWGQIIVTVVITALLALVANIVYYHYTSKSPELIYEAFEVARFAGEQEQIGIYSARVENIGDLEAENVQIILELPYRFHSVQDIEIKPSMKSISYEKVKLTDEEGYEVTIPRLNPNENCYFSIYSKLGTPEVQPFLEMQVRAKGITGHLKEKAKKLFSLILVLTGSFSAVLALVMCIIIQNQIGIANMQKEKLMQYEFFKAQKINNP